MSNPRALGGVLGPGVFVATWALLGARARDYSPLHDPISRLAAVHAPTRPLMTAGLLVFGAGVGAYSGELRDSYPGGAGTAAVACAAGAFGVALAPLDSPLGGAVHATVAGLTYVSLAAVPLLASRSQAARGQLQAATVSIVAGLATAACLAASTMLAERTGLWQRLGFLIGDAWLIASALRRLQAKPNCTEQR